MFTMLDDTTKSTLLGFMNKSIETGEDGELEICLPGKSQQDVDNMLAEYKEIMMDAITKRAKSNSEQMIELRKLQLQSLFATSSRYSAPPLVAQPKKIQVCDTKKRNKRNKKATIFTPHKEPEFAHIAIAQKEPDKPLIVNAHAIIKTSKFKYQYVIGTSSEVDKKLGEHDIIFHDQLNAIADDYQDRIATQMKDIVGKHIRHLNNGFTYKPNNEVELDEIVAIYANAHA